MTIVRANTNLFDLILQTGGSLDSLVDFVVENELSLNQSLLPGQELRSPETLSEPDVVLLFESRAYFVATGDRKITSIEELDQVELEDQGLYSNNDYLIQDYF